MKVKVRQATFGDISEMVRVDQAAWWEGASFNEDQLKAQLDTYPDAILVAETSSNGEPSKIVGIFSGMRLSLKTASSFKSWAEATGDGYYTTHDKRGEVGFGANLSVLPEFERGGIGQRLVAHGVAFVVREGMFYALLGSRIPGLASYNKQREMQGLTRVTGEDYVKLRDDKGRIIDPELRFYLSQPLMELVRVVPGYFPDPDSENYGVVVKWVNPLYKFHLGWVYRVPYLGKRFAGTLAYLISTFG